LHHSYNKLVVVLMVVVVPLCATVAVPRRRLWKPVASHVAVVVKQQVSYNREQRPLSSSGSKSNVGCEAAVDGGG
jgi:short subunit fatty acids transporter